MQIKISATIITFNEERNIARVIESLRCCDEILVLDSGSNDRTVEIATKLGARVEEASWHGYAAQKNIAAELTTHDWVLALDADESVSEALEAEIWQIKKFGPKYDGYTVPRLAQYLGRWILHSGWYPDRKVRLFDKRKAKWTGSVIHESVRVNGSVGHLQSNILHFTCASLSEHLRSMDNYTTLAAQDIVSRHEKVSFVRLSVHPIWTFFKTYVLKRGYLDGVEGLSIAYFAAMYNFVKYAKARDMSPGRKV